MPALAAQDVDTMRQSVYFDGPEVGRKLSRFWILLVLASVIAAAGVVADSTATVIGAMIVAPLMTPIQGTMLAVVTGDRANLPAASPWSSPAPQRRSGSATWSASPS
jgi:hypothetical protein